MYYVYSMAEFEKYVIKCLKKKRKKVNQAGVDEVWSVCFFLWNCAGGRRRGSPQGSGGVLYGDLWKAAWALSCILFLFSFLVEDLLILS